MAGGSLLTAETGNNKILNSTLLHDANRDGYEGRTHQKLINM